LIGTNVQPLDSQCCLPNVKSKKCEPTMQRKKLYIYNLVHSFYSENLAIMGGGGRAWNLFIIMTKCQCNETWWYIDGWWGEIVCLIHCINNFIISGLYNIQGWISSVI
jgi:hypothetical protein